MGFGLRLGLPELLFDLPRLGFPLERFLAKFLFVEAAAVSLLDAAAFPWILAPFFFLVLLVSFPEGFWDWLWLVLVLLLGWE